MLFYARCFTTLILVFLISFCAKSQELWGAANSNYAGQMGIELNPASLVGAPYSWELHILSADIAAMNNYLFLKKHSKVLASIRSGNSVSPDRVTYENTTSDKFANVQAFIKLPAFIISKEKWGLGFHVSSRLAVSARGIPYHLANFMKEGFDFKPQQKKDYEGGNAKVTAMNWHEAGITGGLALVNDGTNYITGGLTLNYLYGLNSFYLLVNNINYDVQADTLWQIYLAKVEYGHASIDLNNANSAGAFSKKGTGLGGNLGFQYYRNRSKTAYEPCSLFAESSGTARIIHINTGMSVFYFCQINLPQSICLYIVINIIHQQIKTVEAI